MLIIRATSKELAIIVPLTGLWMWGSFRCFRSDMPEWLGPLVICAPLLLLGVVVVAAIVNVFAERVAQAPAALRIQRLKEMDEAQKAATALESLDEKDREAIARMLGKRR